MTIKAALGGVIFFASLATASVAMVVWHLFLLPLALLRAVAR